MGKIISKIFTVLFVLVIAFYVIGTLFPDSPREEPEPLEAVELTGYIPTRTPAEIFNETSPYDSGVSIFAQWHGLGAPGTNNPEPSEFPDEEDTHGETIPLEPTD
jgi:hypothetical protein